jgi:hypothetical protein
VALQAEKLNPADMQNIKNRHFLKCLANAGLRTIRFHGLRHTFASLLIQNGEPLTYLKDQLGHSSIKMTVDVYGHLVPGANRQEANRLPSLRQGENQTAVAGQGVKKSAQKSHPIRETPSWIFCKQESQPPDILFL